MSTLVLVFVGMLIMFIIFAYFFGWINTAYNDLIAIINFFNGISKFMDSLVIVFK